MGVASLASTSSPIDAAGRDLEQLRRVSGEVVGTVFFGAMFKAMRDSSLKGDYGHGGRGEEVFGAQLHGIYAEKMGKAQDGGLQEALYRTLEKQQRAMSEAYTRREDFRNARPDELQPVATDALGVLNG